MQFVLEKYNQRNKTFGKSQKMFCTTVDRNYLSSKNCFQSKPLQPVKSQISYLPAPFFFFFCSRWILLTTSGNTWPTLPVFHAFFTHWAVTYSDPYISSCRLTEICTPHVMCSWKFYALYYHRFPSFSFQGYFFYFGPFVPARIWAGKLCSCQ